MRISKEVQSNWKRFSNGSTRPAELSFFSVLLIVFSILAVAYLLASNSISAGFSVSGALRAQEKVIEKSNIVGSMLTDSFENPVPENKILTSENKIKTTDNPINAFLPENKEMARYPNNQIIIVTKEKMTYLFQIRQKNLL